MIVTFVVICSLLCIPLYFIPEPKWLDVPASSSHSFSEADLLQLNSIVNLNFFWDAVSNLSTSTESFILWNVVFFLGFVVCGVCSGTLNPLLPMKYLERTSPFRGYQTILATGLLRDRKSVV